MKSIFNFLLYVCLGTTLVAQVNRPLWLRHQVISPNGKHVAFTYGGDIYTVPTEGGVAIRITANAGFDGNPIWSPNSKLIAFSSDREGSNDIYVVNAYGGNPKRITYSSGNEVPNAFLNDSIVLFNAFVLPSKEFDMFPSNLFKQVYQVSINGDRPKLYSSYPMQMISINNKGELLYTDIKGYENFYRKHEQASVSRDIWFRDRTKKHYTKITNFKGEDRNAVFSPDGNGMFYLSEKDGTSNIYYRKNIHSIDEVQLTHYVKNPVRFLSVSNNGIISFGYDGEMYIMSLRDRTPKKINTSIFADNRGTEVIYKTTSSQIESFALSPNEKEFAFVTNGDVFVANIEYGTTKRITNTPEQERDVNFSPDGKSLIYSSERNGLWNIYMSKIPKNETLFCYSNHIKEEQITHSTTSPIFQASYSPDGSKIAFLRDRTEIVCKDLHSGKEWIIMPGKYEYSYSDGDQSFSWSPDGKWILTGYIGHGGWTNKDIALFASDGSGKSINLTESGYKESDAKWVLDGKAILFSSDRNGLRSHGSWGAQDDIFIMLLDPNVYDKLKLTKEERELTLNIEKTDSTNIKNTKGIVSNKNKKEKDDSIKRSNPIIFDFDNRDMHTHRLTFASGNISDMVMNKEGTKLYYVATYGKDTDLWVFDLDDKSTKPIVRNIRSGGLTLSKDGKNIFLHTYNGVYKITSSGVKTLIPISASLEIQPYKQREYIFSHVWKQVKDKFYDPKLHGVDWSYYRGVYQKFLPHINNDNDFAELLSEMLGELNASHTGARSYFSENFAPETGTLAIFYNEKYQGDGLMIDEIIKGGPLDNAEKTICDGMVILSIDGKKIRATEPIEPLLNGKVGQRISIKIYDPIKKITFEEVVKPISLNVQSELLYRRWLKKREQFVKNWSNGRVAYVHVRSMNSRSFRTVFQDLLGKYRNCDAVVVDTRNNGGGWLHEDLAILLTGKTYLQFTPRGQYIGSDPFKQWTKPSCVLQSEGNYSNGHGFPWLYKKLNIGKLIGAPVPGTMTAVWWETQINPSIVFGIPEVTCQDMDGNILENQELEPDILVLNTPEDCVSGRDVQLKVAVEEMLKAIQYYR